MSAIAYGLHTFTGGGHGPPPPSAFSVGVDKLANNVPSAINHNNLFMMNLRLRMVLDYQSRFAAGTGPAVYTHRLTKTGVCASLRFLFAKDRDDECYGDVSTVDDSRSEKIISNLLARVR